MCITACITARAGNLTLLPCEFFFLPKNKNFYRSTGWKPSRAFPIDMAGFCVSVATLLSSPHAHFSLDSPRGHLETDFLSLLTTRQMLEPRANCCTKVGTLEAFHLLVWSKSFNKFILVLFSILFPGEII